MTGGNSTLWHNIKYKIPPKYSFELFVSMALWARLL